MEKFTTRIALLKADDKDYENLSREIAKDSGTKKRKLSVKPDKTKKGEFNFWGDISLQDVSDAVLRAVRKTGRDFTFTVIKSKMQ